MAAMMIQGSADDVTRRLHIEMTESTSFRNYRKVKAKRCSRIYTFSEKDIRRYILAKKEGRLRFPDLFLYHIQRTTEDVQREARLLKKLRTQAEEQMHLQSNVNETVAPKLAEAHPVVSSPSISEDAQSNQSHSKLMPSNSGHPVANQSNQKVETAKIVKGSEAVVDLEKGLNKSMQAEKQWMRVTKELNQVMKVGRVQEQYVISRKDLALHGAVALGIGAAGFIGAFVLSGGSLGLALAVSIPCVVIVMGTIIIIRRIRNNKKAKNGSKKHLEALNLEA